VVKSGKSAHTDSPLLSVFQQLVSDKVIQEKNLTTGRKIVESNSLYRNGIPEFNGQSGLEYVMWRNIFFFYMHKDMMFGTQLLQDALVQRSQRLQLGNNGKGTTKL
jgi:hypothetical protein